MLIDFRILPHKRQRYDTVGDYFNAGGRLHFRVSRMKDPRYHLLVFIHEIIEYLLCKQAGVKMRDIDKFDTEYEKARTHIALAKAAPCGCSFYEEPGDDPHAPYHRQHQVATACEKLVAEALGVNWEAYGKAVEEL
jgi:hypothetical protein